MGVDGNGIPRFIDVLMAASPMARRKVVVAGQDVYFKPLTRQQLADAIPKDNVKRDPDYAGLFMIVATAEAEDGSKLFRREDIESLRTKVSLELLQQLESAMMGVQAPSIEEAGADLAANPPSTTA